MSCALQAKTITENKRTSLDSTYTQISYNKILLNDTRYSNTLEQRIHNQLEKDSYCVIAGGLNSSVDSLGILDSIFGPRVMQNKKGDLEVIVEPRNNSAEYIYRNTHQPLHTDNGYAKKSPKYVLLQCIESADTGGESLIVQAKQLVKYLSGKYGEKLNSLFSTKAITYYKGNVAVTKPILIKNKSDILIEFSPFFDFALGENKMVETIFLEIINFIQQPKNQLLLPLEPNDLLLLVNNKVLHGRKSFSGKRKYKRIWYNQGVKPGT